MKNKLFLFVGLFAIGTLFIINANAITINEDLTLDKDITDGIVVEAGEGEITINLNNHNVSNTNGHSIKIEKGAKVIITGNGNVTNNINQKAPVYNDGELTINGGNYYRVDQEKNSYYVLLNHGTMTINSGTFSVENGISSLIDNGWYTPSENTSGEYSIMTINGGTFEMTSNDKYIKNDDYGKMTVNGGTFNMRVPSSAIIGAMGFYGGEETVIINGGTFNYTGDDRTIYAIWDYDWNEDGYTDKSTTIVKGGTYNLTSNAKITNGTIEETKKEYTVIGSNEVVVVEEDKLVNKPEVNVIDEETVVEEDKTLIDKVVVDKKYTVAGFYNIDLFKATDTGLKVEQITEADNSVAIKLEIPTSVTKVASGYERTYYIIRVHDGETSIIDTVNNGDGTISFKTDKFSTYSLVYTDTKVETKKVVNPDTSDNILIYIAMSTISLIGLSVILVNVKKRFN